jgi:hypothetical protein
VGCPFFLVRTRRGSTRPARPPSVLPMHARRLAHSFGITRRPSRREDPRALSAGVAQLAEHLFCKQVVGGSSPPASSTLNLGGLPERPKGAGCKPAGIAYVGSNPTPSTRLATSIQARTASSLIRPVRLGLGFVCVLDDRQVRRPSRPSRTMRRARRFVVGVMPSVADVDLVLQDHEVVAGGAVAPAAPTNAAQGAAVAPAAPTDTAQGAAGVAGSAGRPGENLGVCGGGLQIAGDVATSRPALGGARFEFAGVAQLVEHQPSKLNVEGSNPFSRSTARGALGAEVRRNARPHSSVGRARPW